MRSISAKDNKDWMSAHIYRSIGPFIQVNVGSEKEAMTIYLRPKIMLRFAVGVVIVCLSAFAFKLRLIVRDAVMKS